MDEANQKLNRPEFQFQGSLGVVVAVSETIYLFQESEMKKDRLEVERVLGFNRPNNQ